MVSCHVELTFPPPRINSKPHNIIIFSPSTTKAVLNWCHQHSGQPGISSSTSRRRSPRLDQTAARALGSAGSHHVLSGDTTALMTGGGVTSKHPYCTPSQCVAFAAVGGNTPQGHSLSSLSQSTLSLSQHSAGAIHSVAAKGIKNQGRKGTHPVYDKHGDEVIDDDKYDNEKVHIPVINGLCSASTVDTDRERHSLLPR
jgi:hypothetical protein